MNDSHIVVKDGKCQTFVGSDATNYVRAEMLASCLMMYYNSNGRIIPTRGVGIKKMLAMATGYTGRKYSFKDAAYAAEDVKKWAAEMKAALPKIEV